MLIGETIGSYRVLSEIGSGGMGTVYLAEHRHLGRRAAVKVLRPELCQQRELLDRFFVEARATSAIQHPGIVQIVDCEVDPAGRPFMVMELIEGETLAVHLQRCGALPVAEAAALARGVAEALAAAHHRGIVHRDVKPENIFVLPGTSPATKIVDFGIAKLIGDLSVKVSRTQTGTMMGTPLYMSPEQCRGAGTVDWRTDIYSLGCTLFEMLCGRPPFVHQGVGELVAAHMIEPPPRPSSLVASVPPAMDELVLRLLQKAPADRPQRMQEVAAALGPFASSRATRPSRPVETTLRGSATEVTDAAPERPARSHRAPLIAGLLVAAIATAAALWPRGQHTTTTTAALAPLPPAAPAPVAPPSPPPRKEPAPKVAPPKVERAHAATTRPPAERKAKVHLSVDSDPPGAEVCLASDRLLLGNAGVSVDVPADGSRLAFVLRLPGYRVERLTLRADRDQRSLVHLRPLGPDDLESPDPCRRP